MHDIKVRELEEQPAAIVRARVAEDEVPVWCVGAYARVINHLRVHDIPTVGLPFARCAKHESGYDVEAGLPVAAPIDPTLPHDRDDDADGAVHPLTLPPGRAATTWHHGRYPDVSDAYEALSDWIDEVGVDVAGPPWEVYHSPPTSAPDSHDWRIEVIQPIVG